jgi:hypothetical protein
VSHGFVFRPLVCNLDLSHDEPPPFLQQTRAREELPRRGPSQEVDRRVGRDREGYRSDRTHDHGVEGQIGEAEEDGAGDGVPRAEIRRASLHPQHDAASLDRQHVEPRRVPGGEALLDDA